MVCIKKYKLLCCLLISVLLFCACSNKNEHVINFQSKIIKNNNSYDYTKYETIENLAYSFEMALLDNRIDIRNISFEIGEYNNGTYKTVIFTISSNLNITLKFDDKENLMLVNVLYLSSDYSLDDDYSDVKSAILNWDYYNLSSEEKRKCYLLDDEDVTINNFTFESSSIGYTIIDNKYSN